MQQLLTTIRIAAFLSILLSFWSSSLQAVDSNVLVEAYTDLIRTKQQIPVSGVGYNLHLNQGDILVVQFRPVYEFGLNKSAKLGALLRDTANTLQVPGIHQIVKESDTNKFTFLIPRTLDYSLILNDDNRQFFYRSEFHIYAYTVSPQPTAWSLEFQKVTQALYNVLRNWFVFPDFKILVRHCGFENAFSAVATSDITLCAELMGNLNDLGLPGANLFVFFHEVGHSLLRLWGYPNSDNEDDADEFATMFMIMIGDRKYAEAAAKWWASQTSEAEARAKLWIDDRHTISPQRARNILRWLSEPPDRLRRWQKLFVPNMRTEFMKILDGQTDPWVDHILINDELKKRSALAQ